jgi:hypothetical protein
MRQATNRRRGSSVGAITCRTRKRTRGAPVAAATDFGGAAIARAFRTRVGHVLYSSTVSDTEPVNLRKPPSPTPTPSTPAGWYEQGGEQRYWDGLHWTEHRAPLHALAVPAAEQRSPQPYAQPYVRPYGQMMSDSNPNPLEITLAWVLTVLTLGYMLPWAIAATRGKSNSLAVGLVNFLLGWTFVGWIVALVMACTAHQVVATRQL